MKGEVLRYDVRYAFAKGAEVVFTVGDTVMEGRRRYVLTIDGKTTGMVGMLYPLRDIYKSYTDPSTHLPVRAVRNVQEQSYRDYKVDTFDRHTRADSTIVTRETGEKLVLPRRVCDLVSLGYALRVKLSRAPIAKGTMLLYPIYFNAEYLPFSVRCLGVETIRTRFGKRKCYKFVPCIQKGEIFTENDAVTLWFAADGAYEPLRIEFKLFVGSMVCELVGT